ncbi:hypothetical protein ACKWTF_014010 [Chironomus riparius]
MFIILSVIISALYVQVGSFDQYSKSSSSKPYFEVLTDRLEELENNNQLFDFSGLKVRKVNKTRSFIGDIVLINPLGDDIFLEIAAYIKQGGEYRLMPYRIPPSPFCSFCANDTYVYPDLSRNSDFPEDIVANCPLQPKSYKFNGVVYRLENLPKSAMQSGDYALEGCFKRDGIILNKFRIYATIIQI